MALVRNPKADLARNLMTPQHTMADSMDVESDAPSGPDSMSGLLQAGAPTGEPDGDEGMGGQVAPDVAGYEEPATGSDKCQDCEHFQGPNACAVVSGPISPDGWCKLFSPGQAGGEGKGPAGESTGATPMAAETRSDHEQVG